MVEKRDYVPDDSEGSEEEEVEEGKRGGSGKRGGGEQLETWYFVSSDQVRRNLWVEQLILSGKILNPNSFEINE
jgi:hypothetical protein